MHDPLGAVNRVEDLPVCAGIADTGAQFFADKLKLLYPKATWIVIQRPYVEVERSLQTLGWDTDLLEPAAQELAKVMLQADLIVPYHKIDEYRKVIWAHCKMPHPFDENYWTRMKSQNLQIKEAPKGAPMLGEVRSKWLG